MSRASRVDIDGREYYREVPRRHEHDDVEVRIRERERSRDRVPAFLREDRRPEPGPLVLRQREVEERVIRRRSPSPVKVRETRIVRARSVSPIPQRRTEEDVRFRTVVREPSRGPDLDRLRARILSRDRSRRSSSSSSSSSDEPSRERIRARIGIVERQRSPSPVRARSRSRIRIIERKEEKIREPSPQPPPQREVIKGPVIEREVITHYRDIDHGVISARPPSPPPPPRRKERDTEIDIYTSRSETEVDIHRSRSRARGRSRSRSHERVSQPLRPYHHSHSHDDDFMIHAESKHLHVDVEARRSHSHTRRPHSAAPVYRDEYDEAREITSKIDSRGKMGEARNGITKDWTIVDVPPGTERVRMDGAGGAAAEVTWQKYSGVRRSRFIPDRDEKSVVSSSSNSDRRDDSRRGSRLSVQIYDKSEKEEVTDRRVSVRRPSPQRSEMWTEITKDLVIREAIEELGYEYEETEYFFYIMSYLRYEDVLQLVQLSDAVRRARKDRLTEIQWERERGYQDDWDREYRIHAHSHHHHHDGGSRHRSRRHGDDRIVESEVTFERGSKYY